MSASRLAVYSRCGFQYLLEHVLHLEAALEPEERRRIDPLERGTLFHDVAERFLRERRDRGELPVTDSEENRTRALEMAEEALEGLVQGSPPRFTLLWEREKRRFRDSVLSWLGSKLILRTPYRLLPNIVACVGSLRQTVEGDVSGLVVPREDPVALAEAVGRLLDDDDLRRRLADAGHERVLTRFSSEHMIDASINSYRELIE